MPVHPIPTFTPEQLLSLRTLWSRSGNLIASRVEGNSMGATLPDGTQIHLRPEVASGITKGQVIAFVESNKVFVHRVIRRTSRGILTRGDATLLCDRPVPFTAVIGVVTEYCEGDSWRPVSSIATFNGRRRWKAIVAALLPTASLHVSLKLARWTALAIFRVASLRRRQRA